MYRQLAISHRGRLVSMDPGYCEVVMLNSSKLAAIIVVGLRLHESVFLQVMFYEPYEEFVEI